MAVTGVVELGPGRSGGINRIFERGFTRKFQVDTDNPHTGTQAVLAAVNALVSGIYAIGVIGTDAWAESDAGATIAEIKADCTSEDGCTWEVTVDYGPADPRIVDNPLDAPLDVAWSFAQFERVVDVDINGAGVFNSAGDAFDPTITADDSRPVLTISRNEATFDILLAAQYKDHVNTATFFGAGPRCVKVANIQAKRDYHPACGLFWKMDYEFHFNLDTWDKKILDQGMRFKSGSTRKVIQVDGQPASAPVPLNGSGAVKLLSDPAVYLTFRVYPEADFSIFGLE